MGTYLDRVAAAGARVNLEARPSPATPPILPGMGALAHSPAGEGSAFHPAIEDRTAPPTIPTASGTVLPRSAEQASTVAIRSSEPESSRMAMEAKTATAGLISPTKDSPLPARVSVADDLNPDPSPTPPTAALPLKPGARPSPLAPAGRAPQGHDRAPRVTTRVNNDPASIRLSDLSALSALSVPAPSPATTATREHDTHAAETRGREIVDMTPRSTLGEDPVSRAATATTPQPTIAISPAAVAHPPASRSSEAEPRITIGRVDVLVNNQLATRKDATIVSADPVGAHTGLRAHFLDRFSLRP